MYQRCQRRSWGGWTGWLWLSSNRYKRWVTTEAHTHTHTRAWVRIHLFLYFSAFQLVVRPDVVEMHDVTAQEPKLLVHLKATRNTVPVPRHWCFKRKYLQGKRGIEKPPFQLPEFIRRTGIQEMREALQEKVGRRTDVPLIALQG